MVIPDPQIKVQRGNNKKSEIIFGFFILVNG